MRERGALFSSDRQYRYLLWRKWDLAKPLVTFIGLNPSNANEQADDPTLRRLIGFARQWSMGGVLVTNLFARVSAKPAYLRLCEDPVGERNDFWLKQACAQSNLVVAAWGNGGAYMDRSKFVCTHTKDLHCLRLTAQGQPNHPLYLPANSRPQPFPL